MSTCAILWTSIGIIAWTLLGCIVLAGIDDEQQSLLAWVDKAPMGLSFIPILAWPIILGFWIRRRVER